METAGFDSLARCIPLFGDMLLRVPEEVKSQAFDIHLKSGQPLSICGREGVYFLRRNGKVSRALTEGLVMVSREELQEVFFQTCSQSVFSHEQEIRKGYVLMENFCRAGLCGTAVLENGEVKSVRDVSTLVFRIPRENRGCADRLFLEGVDLRQGLLVAGEPSSGKTTLLRDIAFSLSTGKFRPIRRVAVLDERGEIGGGFDLGPCADVLCGYPKARAFDVAIRMLSPEFLICDELSAGDLETVRQSVFAGVALVASVHAGREGFDSRPLCRGLMESGAFGTVAFLAGRSRPGEIESIEPAKAGWALHSAGKAACGKGIALSTRRKPGKGNGQCYETVGGVSGDSQRVPVGAVQGRPAAGPGGGAA